MKPMPFTATVFNVLIASPSDVPAERAIISETIYSWNALNAKETQKVLMPVRWETHTYPDMAGHPQEMINRQIVQDCDLLIAAFWHRIGSPTQNAPSGTVDEITQFVKSKKLSMIYYSDAPVSPSTINTDQLNELTAFKKSIRGLGIQETFSTQYELKEKLFRQLTIAMRGIDVAPSIPKGLTEKVRKGGSESPGENLRFWLEDCTDRSFVVAGKWQTVREKLKEVGGQEVKLPGGQTGLNFSKKRLEKVAEILGVSTKLRSARKS